MIRGKPVERAHGKVVVLTLSEGELSREFVERVELVGSVQFLVSFAVKISLTISNRAGQIADPTDTGSVHPDRRFYFTNVSSLYALK